MRQHEFSPSIAASMSNREQIQHGLQHVCSTFAQVGSKSALPSLQIHLRLVLLLLVAAHVAFFASALIIVSSCTGYITDIDKAGELLCLGALLRPASC